MPQSSWSSARKRATGTRSPALSRTCRLRSREASRSTKRRSTRIALRQPLEQRALHAIAAPDAADNEHVELPREAGQDLHLRGCDVRGCVNFVPPPPLLVGAG